MRAGLLQKTLALKEAMEELEDDVTRRLSPSPEGEWKRGKDSAIARG